MALIFLGVLIVFTVSRFNKSDCLDFITYDKWPQFTRPKSTELSGNAGDLKKAAIEAKTSSRVLRCALVNLVCITRESH